MSAPDLTARAYHGHAHDAAPVGTVSLDYEGRFVRRKVLLLEDGRRLLVDLPKTTSLDHGGALLLESGGEVVVSAAVEPLMQVTGLDLVRLAWHIGNRHTPCQIEEDHLLIRADHVLADMLTKLGATVETRQAPFTPEGGAYGHGRTMGHDHGHSHSHG